MSELDAVQSVLRRQRAHRSFTADPFDDAVISDILELATRAPSAQNTQPWQFIVVQDPARRAAIWKLGTRLWNIGASEATRGKVPDAMHADVEHGVTAATGHGLGSALTSIATFLADELRAILALPATIDPHAIVRLGHPAKQLGSSRREPVREHTHREEYGREW